MNLNKKKVLLVVPKYYHYEKEIKKALVEQGAKVIIIYDNLAGCNLYYRMYYIYMKKKYDTVIYKYYKKRLKRIKKLDVVLAINASSINESIFELIKHYCREESKFYLYLWDSVKNNSHALSISSIFDKVYTFDIDDSQKYGWKYRPLFYVNRLTNSNAKKDIDVSYMCTWHSKRAQILRRIKKEIAEQDLVFYNNMYAPFILFMKHKYINKNLEYKQVSLKEISFKSLSLKGCYKLYQKSKVVVDYTHPGQTGLTMSTIECLGNKCKLVTNNTLIKKADFYNENNILVYEDENVEIPREFISTPYESIPDNIYNYYSLKNWLKSIFA